MSARLDVDALLRDRGVTTVVCCGSGGVGKTTTSAALAVRAAELGRRVVVLTIDPARRLAQALGLDALGDEPQRVAIDAAAGGSLDALVLDMKRTFDDLVTAHTSPQAAAAVLDNPFYRSLSTSLAGTQEYMAMEKLTRLHAEVDGDRPRWDLVVVDTPPSRSALDFLDAPRRLGAFLDGRFVRTLTAPARAGGRAGRILGLGTDLAGAAVAAVVGPSMLADVTSLVRALDEMFGGFRRRADATFARLARPETAFLVVTAPEPDALAEADQFVARLAADAMPLAGVVVNRVTVDDAPDLTASASRRAAATLRATPDAERHATAELLEVHADVAERAERHRRSTAQFAARHPHPLVVIPQAPADIHDLDGLRRIGSDLARGTLRT